MLISCLSGMMRPAQCCLQNQGLEAEWLEMRRSGLWDGCSAELVSRPQSGAACPEGFRNMVLGNMQTQC